MSEVIDLSRLPPPDVVETIDYESIVTERQAGLIALAPPGMRASLAATLALQSEPLTINVQEIGMREVLFRQRVNDASRQTMLAFARGTNLDHLAVLFAIVRKTIQPADPETGAPAVMESDDELRMRTQLAPQAFTVAGPSGAYRSHALNAHASVLDASAFMSTPGEVIVTVLSREGTGEPTQDVLDAVVAALGDDVRPLTDKVVVRGAQIVPYDVTATIYTFPGPDSSMVLDQARARLADYVANSHRLGVEVAASAIFAALHTDGVERVELTSPATDRIPITMTQAARCRSIEITHGGVYGG
ncbi:baseplate assembly protein [Burkholderia gladioli]|uniref:baseplate assembly protein n=1 Tax=Burkholderia gladioli TaxID=28095 RepID=UPI001641690B|nr:baseplate J/gp47 family protein [Burkholderia gladioli]